MLRSIHISIFLIGLLFGSGQFACAANGNFLPSITAGPNLNTEPSVSGHFDFNSNCRKAYDLIFSLRLEEGREWLEKEQTANPANRIPHFLENYIDFFTIYIGEEKSEFKKLSPNKTKRLEMLRSGDPSSPYYRYAQAEVYLQWALARLKFEEYLTAFREVRKAYKLLEENQRRHPDFMANRKSLGLLHAIIGAIPEQYKWGVQIVGLEGTVDQGMGELRELLAYARKNDFVFEQETFVYYALMTLYLENDQEAAWSTVSSDRLQLEGNLLNHFVVSSVAMRTGNNDYAIELLSNRPEGPAYFDFPYLDFQLGLAKLRRLDDDADHYLASFIANFEGRNYIKEAYQKLAWHALSHGDYERYRHYIRFCKTEGAAIVDEDKQAKREAESTEVPDPVLLRSRLLYDGGYYQLALQQLEGRSTDDFASVRDKLEFTYRAGRIYDSSGFPAEASAFYKTTIHEGAAQTYFFAANAALNLAHIYESDGKLEEAEHYYRRSMQMKNKEYRNSIQSRAKAGLSRIRKYGN